MTTMKQLTGKLATEGGCIVASADCDTIELADARARGDFTVDDAGIGYVRRLPGWLRRHSRFARGATDSCEQRADEKAQPVAYAEFADNGCVRVWSRGYEKRLPGTRMVPLYTHSAQAQPPAASVPGVHWFKVRAWLTDEDFGCDRWKADMYSMGRGTHDAYLLITGDVPSLGNHLKECENPLAAQESPNG